MSASSIFIPPKTNVQEFLSNGTFIVPKNVTTVTVYGCGGGGSGAQTTDPNTANGGDGADLVVRTISVTPGASIPVVVGAGGAGVNGGSGATGNAGGNSSFSSITMLGGLGGDNATTTIDSRPTQSRALGQRHYVENGGGNAILSPAMGSGSFVGGSDNSGGGGGAGPFGNGANGRTSAAANSGAGGGGTQLTETSGAGGSGRVIVTW